ncbi:MAG TPA: FkbM family methyltransferase [Chitinophagales bacterium]|nr:FkbM family methyltransferase [Chitinophagales bacterium]
MSKLFLRVLKKVKLLSYFNLNGKVKLNNLTINIPIIKGIGFYNIYGTEPWMITLFKEILHLKKDAAYYDIGVNLGQTLIKLRAVNSEIEYIGFEPNPICVFYSKELIKTNNFKATSIFPVGVSNEDNVYSLSLFSDDDTDSAASMLDNFRPEQKTFRKEYIPCFEVKKILEKYRLPKIGILKIDVEGAEKEVLESFENRILTDRPFIQIEILPVYKEENIERLHRQMSIEALCSKLDYSILRVIKTENGGFERLQEINTIGIHSNMDWCEYLLVHKSDKMLLKCTT